ncbi:hypothetical protein HY489_05445 [Candidatus Woesearchaeota archaeon]|nr:hypothetical protein [Candidatus Woesearchaeota archaeon]
MKWLVFLLVLPGVFACVVPRDGMRVDKDTVLCTAVFYLNKEVSIVADQVMVDCNGAVLKSWSGGIGIRIENRNGVVVKNCRLVSYDAGILVRNSSGVILEENHLVRNKVGVRLVNVSSSATLNHDVSLRSAFEVSRSRNNVLSLTNKPVVGLLCKDNFCNQRKSALNAFVAPRTSQIEMHSWLVEKLTGKNPNRLREVLLQGLL